MKKTYKIIFLTLLLSFLVIIRVFAYDVLILSSTDIIPYKNCIEGLEVSLDEIPIKIVNIKGDLDEGYRVLKKIKKEELRLIIAVGPQAAFVLSKDAEIKIPRVFCMVRNPGKILGENLFPGVSLDIPDPFFQLTKIKEAFRQRKKVGIFFNPALNQGVINEFDRAAKDLAMKIVKFPILSKKDISSVINSEQFLIDILLIIPDDQLRSEKIIGYIIKESLKRKIPVVGYNSWFAKNGALLSFIIDYRSIGLQTGDLAKRIIQGESIDNSYVVSPDKISVSVDLKTARKLGIDMSSEIIKQAQGVID